MINQRRPTHSRILCLSWQAISTSNSKDIKYQHHILKISNFNFKRYLCTLFDLDLLQTDPPPPHQTDQCQGKSREEGQDPEKERGEEVGQHQEAKEKKYQDPDLHQEIKRGKGALALIQKMKQMHMVKKLIFNSKIIGTMPGWKCCLTVSIMSCGVMYALSFSWVLKASSVSLSIFC